MAPGLTDTDSSPIELALRLTDMWLWGGDRYPALVKSVGALVKHTTSADLAASSTCQQFLNADDQTEQQALVDIAAWKGIGGFGSPQTSSANDG
jgi:hypothetical protein